MISMVWYGKKNGRNTPHDRKNLLFERHRREQLVVFKVVKEIVRQSVECKSIVVNCYSSIHTQYSVTDQIPCSRWHFFCNVLFMFMKPNQHLFLDKEKSERKESHELRDSGKRNNRKDKYIYIYIYTQFIHSPTTRSIRNKRE